MISDDYEFKNGINFVAVSTEKAASEPSSLCSFAVVVIENGRKREMKHWFIKPPNMQFEEKNQNMLKRIGKSVEDFHDKPTLAESWEEIRPYLKSRLVVCHDPFLKELLEARKSFSFETDEFHFLSSKDLAKAAFPLLKSHGLSAIAKEFGFQHQNHNDSSDANVTADLILKICQDCNASDMNYVFKKLSIAPSLQKAIRKPKPTRRSELVFNDSRGVAAGYTQSASIQCLPLSQHYYPKHRAQAAKWARALMARDDVCIIDTETTGLNSYDEVVELAAIDLRGRVLFESLLCPKRGSMHPKAEETHGLTMAILENAPTYEEVFGEIHSCLSGKLVLAYNAEYDARLIMQTHEKYRDKKSNDPADNLHLQFDCIMKAWAMYVGEWNPRYKEYKWQKLPGTTHGALGDCYAALEVIKYMANSRGEGIQIPWWVWSILLLFILVALSSAH
jgi:DNA polymerase-3 subunit epsilon